MPSMSPESTPYCSTSWAHAELKFWAAESSTSCEHGSPAQIEAIQESNTGTIEALELIAGPRAPRLRHCVKGEVASERTVSRHSLDKLRDQSRRPGNEQSNIPQQRLSGNCLCRGVLGVGSCGQKCGGCKDSKHDET